MNPALMATLRTITHFGLYAAFGLPIGVSPLHADEVSVDMMQAKMTGVYVLEAWQRDGETFRPPQADGRLIIVNGAFMTILDNRTQPPVRVTTALIGKYEMTPGRFAYGYDDVSIFTEEADAATASHKPLWDGMRGFVASMESEFLRLRQENGTREFLFTDEGLDYFENGKLLRKWHRTTGK